MDSIVTSAPVDLGKLAIKTIDAPFDAPFVKEKRQLLDYTFVKERAALPIDYEGDHILIATPTPLDLELKEELKLTLGQPVLLCQATKEALEMAIERCYHQEEGEASAYLEDLKALDSDKGEEGPISEGYDLLDARSNSPVIRMLNMILLEATGQGASDIHFEPTEEGLIVRYRIDGVLQMRHAPPRELKLQLITRIKVMAKLDIAEHRLPQDGRIKLKVTGREIDFRVSTVPVVYGERVVLRILDKGNVVLGLESLMMGPPLSPFKKLISQNQGIVLVTGPTGSGKTTTLYSALSDINSSDVNIMTIEDPVEYKLPGMAQIGVNHKIDLDFSAGLRHILRQDPDVIMIGEIRDRETAEIAIQSSLTGHLVLSTLHTNDAPSALTRLIDMGIEPYLISSTVLGVLAQRLVRAICPHCKESYRPSQGELSDLGMGGDDPLFYRGRGCSACFQTGYKGRRGLYELLLLNTPIKQQMLKSADSTQLRALAEEMGMKSLRVSGCELVKEGITTSSEVLRVTRALELE